MFVWAVSMRSRWPGKDDEWLSPSNAPTSLTLPGFDRIDQNGIAGQVRICALALRLASVGLVN